MSKTKTVEAISTACDGREVIRRIVLAAALTLAVNTLPPGVALAQSDFLKKGLDTLMGSDSGDGVLSTEDMAAGLREALRVGSERVVAKVGAADGFNLDPEIHIPLPGTFRQVQSALKTVGLSDLADDVELKLNRAAEAAAPEARDLFVQAIREMSLDDAKAIFDGPDDAATQYFKGRMSAPLARKMAPVVDRSLADVGALASVDRMMQSYRAIPFVPDVKADLRSYVVGKALDGIFFYVAKEEAAIRKNPAARSTELLKRVFGSG
ncbi:MAG: DUF4197 domain-containing protein [Kiloniellales bacterium]|nr:DUF4197 domain-containing protein [Kiloniellales bacterium]